GAVGGERGAGRGVRLTRSVAQDERREVVLAGPGAGGLEVVPDGAGRRLEAVEEVCVAVQRLPGGKTASSERAEKLDVARRLERREHLAHLSGAPAGRELARVAGERFVDRPEPTPGRRRVELALSDDVAPEDEHVRSVPMRSRVDQVARPDGGRAGACEMPRHVELAHDVVRVDSRGS